MTSPNPAQVPPFTTIAFSWNDGKQDRRASVHVFPALGLGADDAADIFTAGLAASTDPVYTVESTGITEQTVRAKRPKGDRAPSQVVPADSVPVEEVPGTPATPTAPGRSAKETPR